MSSAKTARWLDLLAYLLQHRFPVTREQIFTSVTGYLGEGESVDALDDRQAESVRRKFERDKDELRALGVEIQTVAIPGAKGDEPASGYQLRARDFYLPYLELTDAAPARAAERPYALRQVRVSRADVRALDAATQRMASLKGSPLAAAAASARRKLGFDLPLSLSAVEAVLARPLPGDAAAALGVLQRAVSDRVAVRCRYFSIGRNADEQRVIEPYGLFFSWGRWYCVARARDRDALRVFRVDRMRDASAVSGRDAAFDVPAGFSVRAYLGRAPWELTDGPGTDVRVRFAFPDSRSVIARGIGTVVEPLLADGGAVLSFAVRDRNPFLRWLLTFGDRATVLEPDDLARELAQLRRTVAALYADAPR